MKSTLIICALPEELSAVEVKLGHHGVEIEINPAINLKIKEFKKNDHIFYTLLSGMGPINASLRLSQVLSAREINQVYLLGVAGGLTPDTKIGDLVISKSVIQHDYYSSLESGNYLMQSGELILTKEGGEKHDPFIPADKKLIECCLATKIEGHKVLAGVIASGSEFVGRYERKSTIAKIHPELLAVDMEACAVANICKIFKKPFIVAKTISDTLHTDGSIESDFVTFLKFAASNAAKVVEGIN